MSTQGERSEPWDHRNDSNNQSDNAMKKRITLITLIVLCTATLFAQAPEKFSYQAVVRNASNALVTDAPVSVRVSVLQGSAEGEVLYVETHSAVTNANGLLTLEIGGGKTEQGAFDRIDWANGPFFLKTETDPDGGGNYSITSVQQLLSVPYALYAKEAANSFSGDYNDLKNKPVIPQNVGELSNDAGYITLNDLPAQPKGGDSPKSASVIQTDACGEIDLCQLANLLAQQQTQIEEMRNALLPAVTTGAVNNVTEAAAICGGTVTANGYDEVTERGVCWGTEPDPTVAGNHTSDGTGIGEFTSTLTNLQPNTIYYVRAYATNSVGTAYGEELSFTTVDTCTTITLPYSEDFESYTTSTTAATGVEPNCWELVHEDAAMTDANRPQLYYNSSFAHSGSYSLKLYYRGIYAMQELDEETDMSQVKLDMYLRQANAKYQLQVGVWDGQNFVSVATFNNSTTDVEHVTCDFSSYNGSGRRIAFRNTLGSGSTVAYSTNYLDDITLSVNTGTVCEAISLPYSEDFDSYTTSTTAATGVEPACWELVHEDAAMTEANRPQLYYNSNFAHSGSYSLKLYNRGIYAMPALSEDVELNNVKLEMYLRQANARYQLQVGVWEEDGTFVPVATFNNSTTEVEHVACDFSSYIGGGRRIAFRNTLGSGGNLNYSTNYLDDIVLSVNGGAVVDEKSCPGTPTVTDHEGNVYATVQIGDQCWMRENLRTTHYADGTDIPAGGDNPSVTEPYYYDNSAYSLSLQTRGYLYNWLAAMHGAASSSANPSGVQGICPNGWHVPSDAEWTQLTDYVKTQSDYVCGGNTSSIAKALASTEGWKTSTSSCVVGNDQTMNNATGFSAVPAGICYGLSFDGAGNDANFWSSTQGSSNYAWIRNLYYDVAYVDDYGDYKSNGFSVRCLRD